MQHPAAPINIWRECFGDRILISNRSRVAQDCELCKIGDDQYCQRCVFTYNGKDWGDDDKLTYGGYSNRIIVNHQ